MNPLQQLVQTRMVELGLSVRAVAKESGGLLSHSIVDHIANGQHQGGIKTRTAMGLARALKVDEHVVREAAFRTKSGERVDGKSRKFVLPKEADELSPEGQRALLAHLDSLLRYERRLRGES